MTVTQRAARVELGDTGASVVVGPALTGRLLALVAREGERLRRQEGVVLASDVVELLGALRTAEAANARLRAGGFASETIFAPDDANPSLFVTMNNVSASLGISPQWGCLLARRGEFPGARRVGRDWLVPSVAVEIYRTRRALGAA